jgi:DNA-binding GntR family transcriptional regulator
MPCSARGQTSPSASDWTPAFHLRIVQASPEQTQNVLHELMRTGTRAMLAVAGRIEQSSPSMRASLRALLSGDATGAARTARNHVGHARDAAKRRIAAATAGSDLV